MIRFTRDRLPSGFRATDWFAVGPAWAGFGEWRRVEGVRLHLGKWCWQARWQRGGRTTDAVTAAGMKLTELFGRRR